MAIPLMEEDVEVISKLGDVPGSDDSLTADQLKNRFDLAGVRIKRFLNEVLVPHMNQLVDVQALLNGILDYSLSQVDKAANAKATGDALSRKLGTAGGTVTGNINMSSKRITNLADPAAEADAANKGYVDGKHLALTIAVPASGWSSGAPYTQTVSAAGILETDNPHYTVVYGTEASDRAAQREAFTCIDLLETAEGAVTLSCFDTQPSVDLTLLLEVNR